MSYIYPTHPLQPSDELLFSVQSIPFTEHIIHEDAFEVLPSSSNQYGDISFKQDKSQTIKVSSTQNNIKDGRRCSNSTNNKKIIHRDIERHRRQEMNALYASLRSQLPLEYLKGKRSISDHMNEAVNYIKDLERKIEELGKKRDKLKRMSNCKPENENFCPSASIRIRPCWPGLEIIICSSARDELLPISRVLRVLVEEGFGFVSCASTKLNGSLVYTILTEASDPGAKDTSLLEHKLVGLLQFESRIHL